MLTVEDVDTAAVVEAEERSARVPEAAPASRPDRRDALRRRLSEAVDPGLANTVAIAAVALTIAVELLYPPAARAEPVPSLWIALVDTTYWALAFAAAAGLIMRRYYGLAAVFGNALVLSFAVIACPVTGHHAFGVWWLAQLACSAAFVLVSGNALRVASRR
jgi:hypothetical protein